MGSMGKYVMWLSSVLIAIAFFAAVAEEADAHRISQGSAPWSEWREVNFKNAPAKYDFVRHRHFFDGTRCQVYNRNTDEVEVIELVALDATNRMCVGDRRER